MEKAGIGFAYHALHHGCPTFWLAWASLGKELPWVAYKIYNTFDVYN